MFIIIYTNQFITSFQLDWVLRPESGLIIDLDHLEPGFGSSP